MVRAPFCPFLFLFLSSFLISLFSFLGCSLIPVSSFGCVFLLFFAAFSLPSFLLPFSFFPFDACFGFLLLYDLFSSIVSFFLLFRS